MPTSQTRSLPASRESALAALSERMSQELAKHEEDLALFIRGVSGLSREDNDFNQQREQTQVDRLKALLSRVKTLQSSGDRANLAVYQEKYGRPPTPKDPWSFVSDDPSWKGTECIGAARGLKGKSPGDRWSWYHDRAETDVHCHFIFLF